jgi:hypothetical protein
MLSCWAKARKNLDNRQASAHGWILATLSFLLEAGRDKSGAFLENLGRISCKTFQRDSGIPVLNSFSLLSLPFLRNSHALRYIH